MLESMVEFKAVSHVFHTPHAETPAIEHISFSLREGEFVSLVGPSGCGKSTVLSLIAGLIRPSEGSVALMGKPVSGTSPAVGYMLQHDHLFDWRTIEKNIYLGLEVRSAATRENKDRARALLDKYGLGAFAAHYPRQLSGGMRQKAALIRTLAVSPQLLLLDEPFSALDYQTRLALSDEVGSIIRGEGKTALLVTHDLSEAISMSDRVLVFSPRPAQLKREIRIDLPGGPIARRKEARFKLYFDEIWKELDVHVA